LEDWKKWESDKDRQNMQKQIDQLLRTPSLHRVFVYD